MVTMTFTREEFEEVREMVERRVTQCSAVSARMATDDWFVWDEPAQECAERWARAERVAGQIQTQATGVARREGW